MSSFNQNGLSLIVRYATNGTLLCLIQFSAFGNKASVCQYLYLKMFVLHMNTSNTLRYTHTIKPTLKSDVIPLDLTSIYTGRRNILLIWKFYLLSWLFSRCTAHGLCCAVRHSDTSRLFFCLAALTLIR